MPDTPQPVQVPDEWLLAAAVDAFNDGRDTLADFDGDDLEFLSDGLAAAIPLIRAAERARIATNLRENAARFHALAHSQATVGDGWRCHDKAMAVEEIADAIERTPTT